PLSCESCPAHDAAAGQNALFRGDYLWHGQIFVKMDGSESVSRYFAYLAVMLGASWMTYRYIEFRQVDNWRRLLPEFRLDTTVAEASRT
ncbi:MAG: hypothetical protein PPHEESC_6146, partial [uncultured Paraburkholderia sp.]